jgi:hypothetical protein
MLVKCPQPGPSPFQWRWNPIRPPSRHAELWIEEDAAPTPERRSADQPMLSRPSTQRKPSHSTSPKNDTFGRKVKRKSAGLCPHDNTCKFSTRSGAPGQTELWASGPEFRVLGALGVLAPVSCYIPGFTFQISRAYSRIDRSAEKWPIRATFKMDIRVQRSRLRQASSTSRWAWA